MARVTPVDCVSLLPETESLLKLMRLSVENLSKLEGKNQNLSTALSVLKSSQVKFLWTSISRLYMLQAHTSAQLVVLELELGIII